MKIKIYDKIHWQLIPETEDMVDLPITLNDLERIGIDKCFNLDTYEIEDYANPRKELQDLEHWFDYDYTHYEQKYRRLSALKLNCDDGISPDEKLQSLYETAENNRRRIQELEVLIEEEQNAIKTELE